MRYSLAIRILLYMLISFSLINGWWFIALPLLFVGIWQFSFRIEILISGVLYDALFGMIPSTGIWGYAGTIVAIIILVTQSVLHKVIR